MNKLEADELIDEAQIFIGNTIGSSIPSKAGDLTTDVKILVDTAMNKIGENNYQPLAIFQHANNKSSTADLKQTIYFLKTNPVKKS
ncbi:hypothetical protein [Dyadobacter diqingensis]|uniref:hypothetical protein n=1 Tax=Dyadobacter diqingensis TaxID=2938121 RepID=UPI0020C20D43|nr:hypothetical protein [Dyadobacter diqingensis]